MMMMNALVNLQYTDAYNNIDMYTVKTLAELEIYNVYMTGAHKSNIYPNQGPPRGKRNIKYELIRWSGSWECGS